MTDTQLLWALVCGSILAFVGLYGLKHNWFYKSARFREQEKAEEYRWSSEVQKAVEAGTHDRHGNPLCRTCNDGKTLATEFDYKVIQTEGFWRWVCMTFFGAPSRYRIVRDIYSVPAYCRDCRPVVERKDGEKLAQVAGEEQCYQEQAAIRLRRHVRIGRDDSIRAELEAHDKESKRLAARPAAPVVPLRSANGS